MRLQLVVNPSAGRGRAARLLPAVERALAANDLQVRTTRSLTHAIELAQEAVADDRVVVAMGGDGLVGAVAGAVAASEGVLAVLPGGRGNDFCRALGVPLDPADAAIDLPSWVEQRVDLGYVGETAFVGIASVGFDSEVQEIALRTRLPLGNQVYVYGSLLTVLRWRHARFTCVVDGVELPVRGWNVAVSNSGRYGGGMRLAPEASLVDGTLDVVTISATSRLRFLRNLPRLFQGTHVRERAVTVRPGAVVRLDADRPFRVFADGDPVAALPCEVTVRAGALRLLAPPLA